VTEIVVFVHFVADTSLFSPSDALILFVRHPPVPCAHLSIIARVNCLQADKSCDVLLFVVMLVPHCTCIVYSIFRIGSSTPHSLLQNSYTVFDTTQGSLFLSTCLHGTNLCSAHCASPVTGTIELYSLPCGCVWLTCFIRRPSWSCLLV